MKKFKSIATIALFGLITLSLGLSTFLLKDRDYSVYERRALQQKPQYGESESLSAYFADWETYLADQLTFRDELRFLKSVFARTILQSSDVNGYFLKDGSEAQLLYPMNEAQIGHNLSSLEEVRQELFADCSAYFAVIPDKSVYMDAPLGLDYDRIGEMADERLQATPIDLTDCLTADDFYRTDIHWKQENLRLVYELLLQNVNPDLPAWEALNGQLQSCGEFYGVLYGQAAYPIKADELNYLTGDWLEGCRLTVVDTGAHSTVYQLDKAAGDDPYDLFLGGENAIAVLENPNVQNGRELVLFRDSFGRSIAPLLAAGYEKIVLIDLRWIRPAYLGEFSQWLPQKKADLLFLLSGQVLNSVMY